MTSPRPSTTMPIARPLRRFRIAVGLLAATVLLLILLEYTPYAVFPAAKTSMLWGVLVGVTGAGLVIERRWAARARRESAAARSGDSTVEGGR